MIEVVAQKSNLNILGNQKEGKIIFENLQKLTNDKLDFNTETGDVSIVKKNAANTDKSLTNGTLLITNIINITSTHVVTIISVERFRASKAPGERSLDGVPLNQFRGNATEYHKPLKNKFNGVGVDITVVFDTTNTSCCLNLLEKKIKIFLIQFQKKNQA